MPKLRSAAAPLLYIKVRVVPQPPSNTTVLFNLRVARLRLAFYYVLDLFHAEFRALRRIIIFWSTARRNPFHTGKRASLAAAEGPRRWRRCGTVSVRGWGRTPDPIPGTPPRGSYGRGAAANFVFLFRSTICTSVTRIDRYRL